MVFTLRRKTVIQAPAEIGGIKVRVSHRARRMALRVDARAGDIILTWPRGTSEKKALQFIEANQDWINSRCQKEKPQQVFVAGGRIAVEGKEYTIVNKQGRGVTHFDGDTLVVFGRVEHTARRLRDFLKERAREVLTKVVAEKMTMLGKKPRDIRIIDPKTRWGSCSPDGRMMFSWRLILMPLHVLDYVAAHEAAHCVHMNHSKKFWALCSSLTPDAASARRWIKTHGSAVMGYC